METNKPKLNVGFFFLCLGLLITLITSVVSFLNLVFSTLDKKFPDILNSNYQYGYSTYDYEGIRMALATLIIFFPIFLLVSHFWRKFTVGEMGHFDKIIKKWVVYIILFISSVVVVVDLVTLVKYFISGEITTRFILKVAVTLIIALFVGIYYILLLQNKEKVFGFNVHILSAVKASVLVLVLVIWSFSVMGSPKQQRLLRLDDRRINDLQNIQYQVINYWQQKEKLPKDLKVLLNPLTGFSLPVPPEFEKGELYEYTVKGPLKFELCASFSLPMPKGWVESRGYYNGGIMPMFDKSTSSISPIPTGGFNESWDHQTGRTCFERTIDKDIYPPYPESAVR